MKELKSAFGTKVVLLLINFAVMADMVVTPVVTGFMESFPDATSVQIDMFLTYPTLFSVLGGLTCGVLARKFSKRNILTATLFVFMLASCGGVLIDNINYILCMRLIVGFSYGMITPLGTGLIAELYVSDEKRASMLGLFNAIGTIIGALMSLTSGYLGMLDWKYSYYVYLVSIPIFLLVLMFVPKTPPEGEIEKSLDNGEQARMPWGIFLPIVLSFILYNTLYNTLLYYVGIYASEAGLGGSNVASIMTATIQVAMFATGLAFSKVYLALGRKLHVAFYLLAAVSFIALSYASIAAIAYLFILLGGIGYGASINYHQIQAMKVLPESKMTFGLGIINTGLGLGGILSSFIRQLYLSVFHIETMSQVYFYVGITFLTLGVIFYIPIVRGENRR